MSEPATASDKAVEAPKAAVSGQTVAKFVKAGPVVKRKNIRKRETDGSDGSDEDEESSVIKSGPATKKKLNTFSTKSDKKPQTTEMLSQLQEQSKRDAAPEELRGSAVAHLEIDDNSKKTGNKWTGIGPVKAPTHIRSTARFDYQPDICKDYRDTGFCGFGDSCKFMHDRGDYKAGWQIEREWDDQQRKKQAALESGRAAGSDDEDDNKYVIESDTEDLPFACFICRESFDTPIETRCKHYFCQRCALDRYAKNTTCAACGKQTYGVFNVATKLNDLIDKRKRRDAAAALAAAREAGDGDSDIDNGVEEDA